MFVIYKLLYTFQLLHINHKNVLYNKNKNIILNFNNITEYNKTIEWHPHF